MISANPSLLTILPPLDVRMLASSLVLPDKQHPAFRLAQDNNWSLVCPTADELPQQSRIKSDCGIFVMFYLDCLVRCVTPTRDVFNSLVKVNELRNELVILLTSPNDLPL
jgi:hypothetical protein